MARSGFSHYDARGIKIGDYAKQFILSSAFKPTKGVTYKVAVIKGELFSDENRISDKIRKEADKRKLKTPPLELALLIRDKFSDEEIKVLRRAIIFVKIILVIGEYERDHGFFLPNPVSIN